MTSQDKDTYTFFASHHHTKALLKLNLPIERIGSSGMTFFLLSFLRKKYRLFGLLIAVFSFLLADGLCWQVNIEGSRESINNTLFSHLADYGLNPFQALKNNAEIQAIQEQLLSDYADVIDWLNLYLDGHTYQISYTPKIKEKTETPSYTLLLASDDAIVDLIEVEKGNVLVKRNQYVKKGETLVSNELVSTDEKTKLIETKGKIYGYVYKTYEATLNHQDNAEGFAFLHLKILEEVEKEIGEDGRISQENVLHYEAKEGTISLKVQFTLYKNIAQKETFNE